MPDLLDDTHHRQTLIPNVQLDVRRLVVDVDITAVGHILNQKVLTGLPVGENLLLRLVIPAIRRNRGQITHSEPFTDFSWPPEPATAVRAWSRQKPQTTQMGRMGLSSGLPYLRVNVPIPGTFTICPLCPFSARSRKVSMMAFLSSSGSLDRS